MREICRGLGIESETEREARLFSLLESSPLVLVLDDIEAAYWAETAAVEALLARLGTVPGLALVISLRGAQRPLGLRWREAIWLQPLPKVPAIETFLAVAGERFEADPSLEELLQLVDGWPLALTLLAHQAEIEPDLSNLRERWIARRSELLRSGADKGLLNIDVSLGLSIDSFRVTEAAKRLLSLLGVLPEGIAHESLNAFFPEAQSAAVVLRQVGLAQPDEERIRALAPVRDYVREKHPIGDRLLRIDSLLLLGDIALVQDKLQEARQRFTASLELSREDPGDVLREAVSSRGWVPWNTGTPTSP